MNNDEINTAMCHYLGGEISAASIMPVNMTDRLKTKYPGNWENIKTDLDKMIEVMMSFEIDWKKNSLSEGMIMLKQYLTAQFPWLNPTTIDKMANYFSYQWK